MNEIDKPDHLIANRVVLAAIVVFAVIPLIFIVADYLNISSALFNPKFSLGIAAGMAFLVDRLYVNMHKRNKANRQV